MVENSQGHSAYSEDALLAARMNVNPGGKQAHMHDGWYTKDGHKVVQSMIFPGNHPTYPNQPKGMKQILMECGINVQKIVGKCKSKFLCIFLPKFHCKLNFIEFFWGMVKKYLHDN
jgi:hypothetical protein